MIFFIPCVNENRLFFLEILIYQEFWVFPRETSVTNEKKACEKYSAGKGKWQNFTTRFPKRSPTHVELPVLMPPA